MSGINKGIGVVALLILTGVGINIYMNTYVSSNTTGWDNMITSMVGNYLPLIGLAAVLIIVIYSSFVKGKG